VSVIEVGGRIRQLRLKAGLTQQQAAVGAGLDTATWNQLERGGRNPSLKTLEAVSEVLGVEIVALFAEEVEGPKAPAPQRSGQTRKAPGAADEGVTAVQGSAHIRGRSGIEVSGVARSIDEVFDSMTEDLRAPLSEGDRLRIAAAKRQVKRAIAEVTEV
jgi:transcriptional regulator with XRE-family HTH domain